MALAPNTEIGKLTFTPKDTNIVHYVLMVEQGLPIVFLGSPSGTTIAAPLSGYSGGFQRTIPASTLIAKADGTVTISVLWRDVAGLAVQPERLSKPATLHLTSMDSSHRLEGISIAVDKLADITGGGIEEGGEGQDFDLDI